MLLGKHEQQQKHYFNQAPSHSWPICITPNVTSGSRATLCYVFSLIYFINLLINSTNIYCGPNRAGSVVGGGAKVMNKTDQNPYFEDAYFLCKRGRLKTNNQSTSHGNECNGV